MLCALHTLHTVHMHIIVNLIDTISSNQAQINFIYTNLTKKQ